MTENQLAGLFKLRLLLDRTGFIYSIIILITQARICISIAVINTDVGLHSECLPQISKQPPLKLI